MNWVLRVVWWCMAICVQGSHARPLQRIHWCSHDLDHDVVYDTGVWGGRVRVRDGLFVPHIMWGQAAGWHVGWEGMVAAGLGIVSAV